MLNKRQRDILKIALLYQNNGWKVQIKDPLVRKEFKKKIGKK